VDAKPRTRTLPSGAAIEEISLARSVPGSVSVPDLAAGEDSTDKAFEIPIELDFDEDREVESDSQEAREALEETPLFSELPPPVLHALIPKVRLVELEAGDVLFKQGDAGSELFVVAEGEVAVVDEGPPRVHLTKLGEGEFFGEVSLVTSQPRNATIEATETTEVLGISREVVSDLVEQEPAVLKVMLRFLRDRLINNLVRSNSLFQPFAAGERESLASKFRFLEVEAGTVMIMQGHQSRGLYVLLAGSAEVVRHDDGDTRRLATLGPGELAGEMSLLANSEAIATVKTTAKTRALEMSSSTFREVIMTHPQVLMYVSEIAEERQRAFEQIVNGVAEYQSSKIELV
jgi:cAMP-dependent protein kinase regulator